MSAGTFGASTGALRRRAAMRAAVARWELTTLARLPRLAALCRRRRLTVPPAAVTQVCHASLRETSAVSCSAAASSRSQIGAVDKAEENSSRLPASAQASTPETASAPAIASATLRAVRFPDLPAIGSSSLLVGGENRRQPPTSRPRS